VTDSTVRHPEWFQDCEKCPEFRWIGHVQDGEQPVRFKFAYLYLLTWSSAWYHLHPFTPSFLWPNRKEMDIRIRHRRQSQEPPVDHQEIMVRPEFPVFLHVLWVFLHKGHNMVKKKYPSKKASENIQGSPQSTSTVDICWLFVIQIPTAHIRIAPSCTSTLALFGSPSCPWSHQLPATTPGGWTKAPECVVICEVYD
jgi:hypothetical protein